MFPRDELRGQPVFLSRVSNIRGPPPQLLVRSGTGVILVTLPPKSQGRNALDDPAAREELVVRKPGGQNHLRPQKPSQLTP